MSAHHLAIDGGRPVISKLPDRGLIGPEERRAIVEVVDGAVAARGAIEYGGEQERAY